MVTAESSKALPSKQLKKTLFLIYPCHLCHDHPGYKSASKCIAHIREHHGYLFSTRKPGISRPKHATIVYQNDFHKLWDEQQFGCPSCWYHTDDMKALEEHMWDHDPGVIQPTKSSDTRVSDLDFVYNGTFFEKKAVNRILQDITDMTSLFKDILKLKN